MDIEVAIQQTYFYVHLDAFNNLPSKNDATAFAVLASNGNWCQNW